MKKAFINWLNRDAEWYEFWHPRSGFIGGVIFGFVLVSATFLI